MIFTPRLLGEDKPSKTILLVDDEAPCRLLMSCILAQAGYTVLVASDGPQAMRHIERDAPIDLLLTDLRMPGMNGVELARSAKRTRPGLPVLFASGFLDCFPESSHEVPSLTKPFTPAELIMAVEASLLRGVATV